MANAQQFTSPAGRLVRGSLYRARDTDAEGRPLVYKTGANIGQPRKDYYFALAIPKKGEQHWAETEWGKLIWQVGHAAFPGGQAQTPKFAWKVVDGDSTVPNSKNVKPVDMIGHKGHWVLSYSSSIAPRIYKDNGATPLPETDAVKLGYWVQVAGNVAGNDSLQQPGVYLNHSMVNLVAYDTEIVLGPDPTSVGFGKGVELPAHVSSTPVGGMPVGAPPPAIPAIPTAAAPVAPPAIPTAAAAVAPPVYPPNPGILAVPAAPVAPAGPRMTAAAQSKGWTYDMLKGGGWTDQQMREQGLLEA